MKASVCSSSPSYGTWTLMTAACGLLFIRSSKAAGSSRANASWPSDALPSDVVVFSPAALHPATRATNTTARANRRCTLLSFITQPPPEYSRRPDGPKRLNCEATHASPGSCPLPIRRAAHPSLSAMTDFRAMAAVRGEDGRRRCPWAGSTPDYQAYHDDE